MNIIYNPFESETDRLKKIAKSMKCPVHRKSVRVTFDYDPHDNLGAVELHSYCCREFAEKVSDAIFEASSIVVYFKDEDGLKTILRS